jgi:hypothetical protein
VRGCLLDQHDEFSRVFIVDICKGEGIIGFMKGLDVEGDCVGNEGGFICQVDILLQARFFERKEENLTLFRENIPSSYPVGVAEVLLLCD